MTGRRRTKRKVAMFIDIANLLEVDLEQLVRVARRLGEIEIARGYGNFVNWRFLGAAAEQLFLQGVRLIHCPGWRNGAGGQDWKDAADELMMVDVCCLLDKRQDIDRFIICTGDGHFVPVVLAIQARGREAIIMGPPNGTSWLLREAADRYRELPKVGGQTISTEKCPPPDRKRIRKQPALQPKPEHPRAGGNGNRRDSVRADATPPPRRPDLPPLHAEPESTKASQN
jgi:hypothetical protein